VHVEIWSDIACPWCAIGKRRFEAALAGFEHRDEVRVTWRSFELDPAAPHEHSEDGATRLAQKYGMTVEQARDRRRAVDEAPRAHRSREEVHPERGRLGRVADRVALLVDDLGVALHEAVGLGDAVDALHAADDAAQGPGPSALAAQAARLDDVSGRLAELKRRLA
jgi:hypothetical protein